MKMKMLFGFLVISIVSAANGLNVKDYFTGSGIDKEGKTLRHRYAENCEDINAFKRFLQSEAVILLNRKAELNPALFEELPSVFIKDNNGQTALDIAREMYKKTGNRACLQVVREITEEMGSETQK